MLNMGKVQCFSTLAKQQLNNNSCLLTSSLIILDVVEALLTFPGTSRLNYLLNHT